MNNLELLHERAKLVIIFRKEIDELISNTPTGETRNKITNLNILFEEMLNYNDKIQSNLHKLYKELIV